MSDLGNWEPATWVEWEEVCEAAVNAMYDAMTVTLLRDDSAVRCAVGNRLSDPQVLWLEEVDNGGLEHECLIEAVAMAIQYYESESGGSHDLSELDDLLTWDRVAALPLPKREQSNE